MNIISIAAISPNMPHLSQRAVTTRQYAYLVQQMGQIISLSNYVLGSILEDDAEQWLDALEQPPVSAKYEQAAVVEAQQQLERRRVFNSIMLCQIYDAFDLYCVRMRKVLGSTGRTQAGESSLDCSCRVFSAKGLTFLNDEQDYDKAAEIKDCRNLITHENGLADARFHRKYPRLSDGLSNLLHIYSEELQEHTEFLTRACYDLDGQVSRTVGVDVEPISEWTGPSSVGEDVEDV